MIYVQAPARYRGEVPSLYLAGAVARCDPWRRRLADRLSASRLALLDPERPAYARLDAAARTGQIEWELHHLKRATMRLFWFPPPTLCPVSLYELGAWAITRDPLFVSVNPAYPLREDVEQRMALARPDVAIARSLDELGDLVLAHLAAQPQEEVLS